MIVKSGVLDGRAIVLDLKDHERGLVWIENRFSHVLPSGLAYWTGQKDVRVEVVDARNVRFEHDELKVIARSPMVQRVLDVCTVGRDHVGVLFIDGRFVETLAPGLYAFWKGEAEAPSQTVGSARRSQAAGDAMSIVEAFRANRPCLVEIDLRETMVDVGGRRGRIVLNACLVNQAA